MVYAPLGQLWVPLSGSQEYEDYRTLGPMLGSFNFGKVPLREFKKMSPNLRATLPKSLQLFQEVKQMSPDFSPTLPNSLPLLPEFLRHFLRLNCRQAGILLRFACLVRGFGLLGPIPKDAKYLIGAAKLNHTTKFQYRNPTLYHVETYPKGPRTQILGF